MKTPGLPAPGSGPVASFLRRRSILLATVVIFALAFAILWSQREPGASFSLVRGPFPGNSALSTSVPRRLAPLPTALAAADASPPGPQAMQAVLPAPEIPPERLDGPPLPVVFSFGHRRVGKTVENAAGEDEDVYETVVEGIVLSESNKPLTVSVVEVNVPTQDTTQTQFVLGRGVQRRFGVEQGLKMESGDQVTLRNPSYRDLTLVIP